MILRKIYINKSVCILSYCKDFLFTLTSLMNGNSSVKWCNSCLENVSTEQRRDPRVENPNNSPQHTSSIESVSIVAIVVRRAALLVAVLDVCYLFKEPPLMFSVHRITWRQFNDAARPVFLAMEHAPVHLRIDPRVSFFFLLLTLAPEYFFPFREPFIVNFADTKKFSLILVRKKGSPWMSDHFENYFVDNVIACGF